MSKTKQISVFDAAILLIAYEPLRAKSPFYKRGVGNESIIAMRPSRLPLRTQFGGHEEKVADNVTA